MHIYLAGCGQIGQLLGRQLSSEHRVTGLKRSEAALGFPLLRVDLRDRHAVEQLPQDADIIVFTVTPSQYDEAGYHLVYESILGNVIAWAQRHAKPPLLILVSSTGVYGQQQGEWVDENSPTLPKRASAQWILFGEQQLHQQWHNHVVVRFSGIYGDTRTRLIHRAISGEAIQKTPPLWTNRIHESDCVGVLAFLIARYQHGQALQSCYLASDDEPVSQYDVAAYICQQLGRDAPIVKTENLSPDCNKRCDNSRLKALGYAFSYPSYRHGYQHILANRDSDVDINTSSSLTKKHEKPQ